MRAVQDMAKAQPCKGLKGGQHFGAAWATTLSS